MRGRIQNVTKRIDTNPRARIEQDVPERKRGSTRGRPILQQKIAGLRWIAPLILLLLAALHQLVLRWLWPRVPAEYHFWLGVALYGLSGSVVAWLALGWLARNAEKQAQTEAELHRPR
jgi:hypothetical protein